MNVVPRWRKKRFLYEHIFKKRERPAKRSAPGEKRHWRPALLITAVIFATLAAGLILAACSGGSSNAPISTGGNNSAANREQGMKFASCMRDNGVSAFPDPDANGNLTIDQVANGSSLDTKSAAFKQAMSACQDLEPPGFTGTKRSAQQQEAALKFAQCVRDNGVKDFPDPTPDGPIIDTSRMPGSPSARSIPGLQAAMQKCRDYATGAGVPGGGNQ